MNIKEERAIAVNLRADLESKIRRIVPNSNNYETDKLSKKLESLNDKLTREEQIASKKFLYQANLLIHSDEDNYHNYRRSVMEGSYETINRALDRIATKSKNNDSEKSVGTIKWVLIIFIALVLLNSYRGNVVNVEKLVRLGLIVFALFIGYNLLSKRR